MAAQDTEKKPPPFYCPKCGQKHRADITPLQQKPGSVLKAKCKGCGLALGVSMNADGTLKAAAFAETPSAPEPLTSALAAPPPAPVAAATARRSTHCSSGRRSVW